MDIDNAMNSTGNYSVACKTKTKATADKTEVCAGMILGGRK